MRVLGRVHVWLAGIVVISFGALAVSRVEVRTEQPRLALSKVDIDHYPARTRVTACSDPVAPKPGVADFRALILSQVGGSDDGLAVCKQIANGSGSLSDHADGRAWDWHVEVGSESDRAMVDAVLDWLLRSDERGNRNAMARRLGITYIIWNHGYYRVGSDQARWTPYTATSDPHDTHVHFSFSVAGAQRKTSWWSERGPLVWLLANGPDVPFEFGEAGASPLAGDWDGDGRDTVGVYHAADRTFATRDAIIGGAAVRTPPIGPFGAIPLAGNWDGIGGDEVGLYEPATRLFSFYFLSGTPARAPAVFGAPGDLPIVGDWNGDGVDDVGTYSPTTRTYSRLRPDGSVQTQVFGGAKDTPVVGDWNGDGQDDIGAFRSANRSFHQPANSGGDGAVIRPQRYGPGRHLPIIGDWDGDGADSQGMVTTGRQAQAKSPVS